MPSFVPFASIPGPEQGLAPPRPTRSKPLSAYPLTTRRPPVASCGVEEAREVMERAREHAHAAAAAAAPGARLEKSGGGNGDEGAESGDGANVFSGGGGVEDGDGGGGGGNGGAGAGAGSGVVAEGIRSLIRATWEDVKDWCDEEAEARVRRKDAQVRAAAWSLRLPTSRAVVFPCSSPACLSCLLPLSRAFRQASARLCTAEACPTFRLTPASLRKRETVSQRQQQRVGSAVGGSRWMQNQSTNHRYAPRA